MWKNILFTRGHEVVTLVSQIVRGLFIKCMYVLMKISLFGISLSINKSHEKV